MTARVGFTEGSSGSAADAASAKNKIGIMRRIIPTMHEHSSEDQYERMKNWRGAAGLNGNVKLKLPLASNRLVATGCQLITGTPRSMDVSTRYSALAGPPLPLKITSGPTTLTEPISNEVGATTFNVPSTVSWDVSHVKPGPGVAGTIAVNDPEAVAKLKRCISSPLAKASPVRLICNVP